MADTIDNLIDALMRPVAASGAIRRDAAGRALDGDIETAMRVMHAELVAFLSGPAYAAERDLAQTGGAQLAMASLVASTVARIVAERPQGTAL